MEHNFNHSYAGRAELSNITPHCSCGWKGTPVFAWQDYQLSLVKLQESDHLRQVRQESKIINEKS